MIHTQKDVRKEIATRLKIAREQSGYRSREEFCYKNSFNLKRYKAQEEGVRSIKASELLQYCNALNISFYTILIGKL